MISSATQAPIRFDGASVLQQTPFCLNRRHRAAGCTQCVTDCPVDAIALVDGAPALDAETCIRCGLCLQTCPTSVFSQPNPAEVQLLAVVAQQSAPAILLVCPAHSTPSQSTAPVDLIVQHRRCLAALSIDQVLALSQAGARTVWLDDQPCISCPLGVTQARLHKTITSANTLLQAFGRPAMLTLCSTHAAQLSPEPEPRPLIDAGNPPVTRRKLFAALGQVLRGSSAPVTATRDDEPSLNITRLRQQVPPQRTALQQQLQQCAPSATASLDVATLPFADIQLDPGSCSACGLCARFCPTGALHFTAEAAQFCVTFQPAICIACPLCTAACPEDAILMGDSLSTAALVATEWQPLVAGRLTQCQQCGVPTAHRPDDQAAVRCYACRQGAGVVQPLRDGAGLMADLLTKLPLMAR